MNDMLNSQGKDVKQADPCFENVPNLNTKNSIHD